jgi:hypothetical protein
MPHTAALQAFPVFPKNLDGALRIQAEKLPYKRFPFHRRS